jgi:hypothetical protein
MRIGADVDDAPEFIESVERICLGVLDRYAPAELALIKIDNWFGSKWLGFSGKALGLVGVWNKPYNRSPSDIRIPPFVPNRVVLQRRFSGPSYDEVPGGEPIHKKVHGSDALLRKAAIHAPQTALVWYSGKSITSARGALMAYVPSHDSYWAWYAGWEKSQDWKLQESWDIKPDQIAQLINLEARDRR